MSAAVSGPTNNVDHIVFPPKARKEDHSVFFGECNISNQSVEDDDIHDSNYRGNNPMTPPLERIDPYFWMRDDTRKRVDVIDHLNAENQYCEKKLEHLSSLRDELYSEMLYHMKETDQTMPYNYGPYKYYSKTEKGLSYPIHCRKITEMGEECVVLDGNEIAKGFEYCDINSIDPSPSHRLLAYSVDNNGYETYRLRVKSLEPAAEGTDSNEQYLVDIADTSGAVVWGNDDSTLFYLKMDAEHRPFQLWLHVVGGEDLLLLQEDDGSFWMDVDKTQDQRYLVVSLESPETSEQYVVDLRGLQGGDQHRRHITWPTSQLGLAAEESVVRCLQPRRAGLRYEVEHQEGQFYFLTNQDGARNNKLMRCAASLYFSSSSPRPEVQWEDVRAYDSSEQLEALLPLRGHLALLGRQRGLQQLWVAQVDALTLALSWREVSLPEQAYSLWFGDNREADAEWLRLGYSSPVTPKQVLDYHPASGQLLVRKQQEVPGFDPALYAVRRLLAPSRDGQTLVPISLVSKLGLDPSPRPLLLYGYGSYGVCVDPSFDSKLVSLLDRGVVYAIAHVRGGGDGPPGRGVWYEQQGKYLHKTNTFTDFADCARYLVEEGLTASDRMACVGRSAGGLLVGAVVNMFPGLFKAAVADVPFVDVMNTMSDPSIPLTVTEWEEWGNPNEAQYFHYMLSYSPYDNVKPQDYPALLVTAGLNDPRVAYWEPAKWVARLREMKTNPTSPVLLKTDMSTGHFSASDRYKYIRETAFEYSFILDQILQK